MITLNLISPEQQNNLRLKYRQALAKNCLGVLVMAAVVLAIFLIPVNQQINDQQALNANVKKSTLAKNQAITEKVELLNAQIGDLIKIKNRLFRWSNALSELAALTPLDVALLEFNGSAQNADFSLKGFAKTREGLIKFQNNLLHAEHFKEISSPLENYLQKDEVTWQISGKLNQ